LLLRPRAKLVRTKAHHWMGYLPIFNTLKMVKKFINARHRSSTTWFLLFDSQMTQNSSNNCRRVRSTKQCATFLHLQEHHSTALRISQIISGFSASHSPVANASYSVHRPVVAIKLHSKSLSGEPDFRNDSDVNRLLSLATLLLLMSQIFENLIHDHKSQHPPSTPIATGHHAQPTRGWSNQLI